MPTLASSSRAQLAYITEAVLGTTPAAEVPGSTPPQLARLLRMTGESLNFNLGTETSKEIRGDRMTADNFLVSASASGGFNFEFSYQEYDPFIAAALQNNWTAQGTNGDLTLATGSFSAKTLTAGSGTPFATVEVGQWVKIASAVTAVNNGIFKVTAKSPTSITTLKYNTLTQQLDPTFSFTTEAATANVKVITSRIKNGQILRGFTIEKRFEDVAQALKYTGMTPSKMNLNFASGAAVTGSFDFMGMGSARDTSTMLPAAGAASQNYPVVNAVRGVGAIQEGGVDLSTSTFVKSLSISLDNNLRTQDAIGVLGAAGVGSGTLKITGNIEVYFADGTLYDKFLNSTASSFSVTVLDNTDGTMANGYNILIPKLKFTSADIKAGAMNQDIMVSMAYEALMDPITGAEIVIDRFGATATVS